MTAMHGNRHEIILRRWLSPVGELLLGSFGDRLCLCDWASRRDREHIDNRLCRHLDARFVNGNSPTIEKAITELAGYFDKSRRDFTVPLLFCGTDFQLSVWRVLPLVPYGTTVSYGQLAEMVGNPKAVRAVAAANGANALSIFVPCHRVIGSDGTLTGYAGGVETKRRLLRLECG